MDTWSDSQRDVLGSSVSNSIVVMTRTANLKGEFVIRSSLPLDERKIDQHMAN